MSKIVDVANDSPLALGNSHDSNLRNRCFVRLGLLGLKRADTAKGASRDARRADISKFRELVQ